MKSLTHFARGLVRQFQLAQPQATFTCTERKIP